MQMQKRAVLNGRLSWYVIFKERGFVVGRGLCCLNVERFEACGAVLILSSVNNNAMPQYEESLAVAIHLKFSGDSLLTYHWQGSENNPFVCYCFSLANGNARGCAIHLIVLLLQLV